MKILLILFNNKNFVVSVINFKVKSSKAKGKMKKNRKPRLLCY